MVTFSSPRHLTSNWHRHAQPMLRHGKVPQLGERGHVVPRDLHVGQLATLNADDGSEIDLEPFS
jgi:hypothetical protein